MSSFGGSSSHQPSNAASMPSEVAASAMSTSSCAPAVETFTTSRVILDSPSVHPDASIHWQGLTHKADDQLIRNRQELVDYFRADILSAKAHGDDSSTSLLAKWSCICGYCESLTTHKDATRRFLVFPIPITALVRLVEGEFVGFVKALGLKSGNVDHRDATKRISNEIWKRVMSKPSIRDEHHANSLYICLRGHLDKRTLDCFGAAVVTVAGLHIAGYTSLLTLSEDHAYESHPHSPSDTSNPVIAKKNDDNKNNASLAYATCEVAVPGNNKVSQQKRGREISETFSSTLHRKSDLTPQTSWLYMAAHPVICFHVPMAIAAILGNVNCQIETKQGKAVSSKELYEVKRDLLWALYDEGYLQDFPFALSELGECEENVSSPRGLEWIKAEELGGEEILMNEKLFLDSIKVSREKYADGQVYPYCYAGHYHKDAGRESSSEEYRLVEAMRLYYHAARVASQYIYEPGDSLQLVRTITKIADLIAQDILSCSDDGDDKATNSSKRSPRQWAYRENAIAAGTWLLGFFDSCLLWEERSGGGKEGATSSSAGKRFVEILNPSHKSSMSKLFQLLELDVRKEMISRVYDSGGVESADVHRGLHLLEAVTETKLQCFRRARSLRLASRSSPLAAALVKKKISMGELEFTIPISETGRRRARKRAKTDL